MSSIITRFAPSPSGYLHVGGARTAIFNWLYARHTGGKFILRIEDTDAERSTEESVAAILDGMKWLGLDWDEGPVFQTQRMSVYREYVQSLIDERRPMYAPAHRKPLKKCARMPWPVVANRNTTGPVATGGLPLRRVPWCGLKPRPWEKPSSNDVIKGNIAFQNEELDDFVIQRSNGTPTYNFAVVVDDIS